MYLVLQLILLFVFGLTLVSLFRSKFITLFLATFVGLGITLQLVSIFLGNALIDYKFIEHLSLKDLWAVRNFYTLELIIGSTFLILLITTLLLLRKKILSRGLKKQFIYIVGGLTLIAMSLPNGIITNLHAVAKLKYTATKSFHQSLKGLGIDPSLYPEAKKVKAQPGKNIIVISLESLERGYLEAPLQHLTPQLQELKNKHTYYNMLQNEGSGWTTASMYTVLTGMPAFFKESGNETFQNAYGSNIASLGSVLQSANYDMTYLIGNKEFSGIQDMLSVYGFNVKSEKDLDTIYPKTSWGLHDKDLFYEAKKELSKKKASGKPFALFLSTISGHFPNGVEDKRLTDVFPNQESNIEYMTYAVDHYIGDLMNFLVTENLLETTQVFIFPDHELMGTTSSVLKKFKKRGLYLITTASDKETGLSAGSQIHQIDLPRLITDGAGIKTNASFLSEFITDNDKNKFIQKHKQDILRLNESSILRGDFMEGITLSRKHNNTLHLASPQNGFKTEFPSLELYKIYTATFDKKMRFISLDAPDKKVAFAANGSTKVIFYLDEDHIYAYLKKGEFLGVAKKNENRVIFNKSDLDVFRDWAILTPPLKPLAGQIQLKSSGFHAFKSHGISQVFVGLASMPIKRGLNLITQKNGQYNITHYDTYSDPKETKALLTQIKTLQDSNQEYYLLAHDSAEKELNRYGKQLQELGFKQLPDLQSREAYIGYFNNGVLQEFKDTHSVTASFTYKITTTTNLAEKRKDSSRFIAHAGGMIDNQKYTNSLEALNYNYAKGFRFFELDIIKTSDDKFVAAHDWKIWKEHSGFSGNTPVSENVFKSYKLKNKYTPLSMDLINDWFAQHEDAILVTDKINTPEAFATAFIDRDRLMMELFTLAAVQEGQKAGIKTSIVSENVLNALGQDKIKKLNQLKVKAIAISRKNISQRLSLIQELEAAGIKTYVYHVNFEKGKDEEYVFLNEMQYVYGMYADQWEF